eukprot:TRINITY_DN15013_c0_g1_i1.p1 TRINITY_DN15013_c0_g1~~TRINITY_DN15013_c0_g1_i1.p1  ORF type:complete len:128 (-),score=7.71 TRINITY_DN15013_c0_g1_i1:453-812(-)
MDDDFHPSTMPNSVYPYHPSHAKPALTNVCLTRSAGNIPSCDDSYSSNAQPLQRELNLILKEIKVITDKIKDDEESASIEADWKFAAMVLDRLCLVFFTVFTIVATLAVLAAAPHVIVK